MSINIIGGGGTSIPTNVVEVGNEISQNQLNAITSSASPSSVNPFQTSSAVSGAISSSIINKQNTPAVSWGFSFPIPTNFPLAIRNGSWVPLAPSGTTVGEDAGSAYNRDSSYYFDFTDDTGNYISLNGTAAVGLDNVTVYYSNGNYDGDILSNTTSTNFSGTGPFYAGNWDNPVNSASFLDSSFNTWYRYVYLDGNGGFYTADNQNNPPY